MAENEEMWIQGAVKKHPGALRHALIARRLMEPDQKIPVSLLRRAAKGDFGAKNARRAHLALKLRQFQGNPLENPSTGVTILLVVSAVGAALAATYLYRRFRGADAPAVEYMGVTTVSTPEEIAAAKAVCVAKGSGWRFESLHQGPTVPPATPSPYVCFPPAMTLSFGK